MKATENIFLPVKARPGEVIIVHSISVYNNTANIYWYLYELIKRRGFIYRVDFIQVVLAAGVHLFNQDLYLIDGDEAGIAIRTTRSGATVQVTIQFMRLRDDEYFKST